MRSHWAAGGHETRRPRSEVFVSSPVDFSGFRRFLRDTVGGAYLFHARYVLGIIFSAYVALPRRAHRRLSSPPAPFWPSAFPRTRQWRGAAESRLPGLRGLGQCNATKHSMLYHYLLRIDIKTDQTRPYQTTPRGSAEVFRVLSGSSVPGRTTGSPAFLLNRVMSHRCARRRVGFSSTPCPFER